MIEKLKDFGVSLRTQSMNKQFKQQNFKGVKEECYKNYYLY